jgi:hypothetical protein
MFTLLHRFFIPVHTFTDFFCGCGYGVGTPTPTPTHDRTKEIVFRSACLQPEDSGIQEVNRVHSFISYVFTSFISYCSETLLPELTLSSPLKFSLELR